MRNVKFAIASLMVSICFSSCKPKPVEKEASKVDSLAVEKPETASVTDKSNQAFFKAVGTEPFWGIEIAEDSLRFASPH